MDRRATLIAMTLTMNTKPPTLMLLLWLVTAASASGQVLVTGETGGAGAHVVVASANLISAEGVGNLGNLWGQYGYGLTDRVDVFAFYGNITVSNDTQHYGGIGSNVSLLRRAQHGLDLSLLSNASVPMSRRHQAATVLVGLALVASRPLTIGSTVITPYGGFNTLAPMGQRDRGLFTPVETQHAGIVGVAMPLHRTLTAYLEYNHGPAVRSGGLGLLFAIPRREGR